MNTNESQNKDNQIELTDLEPNSEVKGGPANLLCFDTNTPSTTSGVSITGSSTGNFTLTFNGKPTVGL